MSLGKSEVEDFFVAVSATLTILQRATMAVS
jgi:hypothetical protein